MSADPYPGYRGGALDPQVRRFLMELSESPSVPLRLQTTEEIRQGGSIAAWTRKRGGPYRSETIRIDGGGSTLPVRVYTPDGLPRAGDTRPAGLPVILYFHGGGWVFGSLDDADHVCGGFASDLPAVVVSVDYRLSPEHRFPCALDDAYAALEWTAREISRYGGDPERLCVAGESAGANLAAEVSLLSRDRSGPRIAFQLLLCPCTDLAHLSTESFGQFGDGRWLSKANIEYYYAQYLENREQAFDPRVSPLLAPDLGNLPPAHILTAEFDVLRDEGEAYARALREAGNLVTQKRYRGVIHAFYLLNGVFDIADTALDECGTILKTRLAPDACPESLPGEEARS